MTVLFTSEVDAAAPTLALVMVLASNDTESLNEDDYGGENVSTCVDIEEE